MNMLFLSSASPEKPLPGAAQSALPGLRELQTAESA